MEEYTVKSVVLLNKKKYKILLEGTKNIFIALYPSELRKYNIQEGSFLSKEHYKQIEEVLFKRGKERALYYLKNSDKTAYQMRSKLREGFYPENVIDDVISFLNNYGYIDDLQYAIRFISYNINRNSCMKIKEKLRIKGISKDIIDEAFENIREYDEGFDNHNIEIEQIRKQITKKIRPDMDIKSENKLVMSLVRKGFLYEDVNFVLKEVKNTIFSV